VRIPTEMTNRPRRELALTVLVTASAVLVGGCGPPQVKPEHRELVLRLATAASTRDPRLLESASREVDDLRDGGEFRGPDASALGSIIEAGRAGDWDRAQRLAYSLREAQRPTPEDLERIRARTLPPMKPVGSPAPSP
jgi:hypothetical protein